MATPTSSSNRSKRKAAKPVTTDKGRNNRAKVSTAKPTSNDTRAKNSSARVTNASQRAVSGSAKVTGTSKPALPARSSASDLQRLQTASKTKPTRPAPRSIPKTQGKPALPPGQKGGALVSTGTRQSRAEAKAKAAAQGSTGPNRVGRSDARPALPQGRQGSPLAKGTPGGAMTRVAQTATKAGRFGRVAGPVGVALAAVDQARNVFNPKDNIVTRGAQLGRSIERVVGGGGGGSMTPAQRAAQLKAKRGDYAGPGGKSDGSGQGQARQTTPRVNKARQDQMRSDLNRDYPLSTASQRRGSTQSGGGSTQSRSGGGTSRPAAPRPQSGPASNAGMKNQDKNYRGNLFEKTFGYKKGEAPDQVKARREANSSKPEDKSRYVASNGKPYAGPGYGGQDQKTASGKSIGGTQTPAQTAKENSKPLSIAEQMRRRRMGMA